MYCPNKNSYLQLECAFKPQVLNKAVRRATRKTQFDPHDETPAAQRLTSMQPSLYAPWIDITRARLGYGRDDLRNIAKAIHSEDSLIQLQALHSILDQVQISEKAIYLINRNIPYRLVDLMRDRDPIAREKVLLILIRFISYYQARNQILSKPVVIDHLTFLFLRDRKEIRYAAALLLEIITRRRCGCEIVMKNDKVVESILKMINNEHITIIIIHTNTLRNLAEWDPVPPLKANAFQAMKSLMAFNFHEYKVIVAALECLIQLCKHPVGKKLADQNDMTRVLSHYLMSPSMDVIISALGLMGYTTITSKSKWRVKEFTFDLVKRLVALCETQRIPLLQLRAMQVLINLCDCPDARAEIKRSWEFKIKKISIINPEEWDGTTFGHEVGLDTGHYYRTTYDPGVEEIHNFVGDNPKSLSVYAYLHRVHNLKMRLIKAINMKPCVQLPHNSPAKQ